MRGAEDGPAVDVPRICARQYPDTMLRAKQWPSPPR
jgi:hypothetical protein